MKDNKILCESVWGSDDYNPFEINISMGYEKSYGSYLSGLPEYEAPELQQAYSSLKEFAKMAIEKRFCNRCRFPWVDFFTKHDCECGHFEENKEDIKLAELAALSILEYDQKYVQKCAEQMGKDLEDDSEYARLSRKAREIITRKIKQYYADNKSSTLLGKIKSLTKNLFTKVTRWLSPTYWKWHISTPEIEKSKNIPLNTATDSEIKSMSTSRKYGGLCYVRTKTGSVVVVPASELSKIKNKYKDATLVAPVIES